MSTILELIDDEIAHLKSARELLVSLQVSEPTTVALKRQYKKRRKLSPEGRARIVAALKARWAAKKK
jgi:hypothetical protein